MPMCVYLCTHALWGMLVYVCLCAHLCICVHVCVCIYIYACLVFSAQSWIPRLLLTGASHRRNRDLGDPTTCPACVPPRPGSCCSPAARAAAASSLPLSPALPPSHPPLLAQGLQSKLVNFSPPVVCQPFQVKYSSWRWSPLGSALPGGGVVQRVLPGGQCQAHSRRNHPCGTCAVSEWGAVGGRLSSPCPGPRPLQPPTCPWKPPLHLNPCSGQSSGQWAPGPQRGSGCARPATGLRAKPSEKGSRGS